MTAPPLRMVAWEVTRQCNLSCLHCRASAQGGPYEGELTSREGFQLLDDIASFARPVVILTGGEPLLRPDILDIANHGTVLGLRMVMAPNGTLLTAQLAEDLRRAGIQRVSISLDGSNEGAHDAFRGVPGAYEGALRGIRAAKEVGLPFQINTTVTRRNVDNLVEIMETAVRLGAVAHHIFLLVPTGRGKEMAEDAISPEEYERVLNWLYDQRELVPIELKATCAPHYFRILRHRARREGKTVSPQNYGLDATTRGCLGGTAFCFISHRGDVQPCGYLDIKCGNVRQEPLSSIWETSEIFFRLRDLDQYKGKCGRCEYRTVCGGCRARAYESTGDYLEEEPFCTYQPLRGAQ
jgi:heme b synthase